MTEDRTKPPEGYENYVAHYPHTLEMCWAHANRQRAIGAQQERERVITEVLRAMARLGYGEFGHLFSLPGEASKPTRGEGE